MRKGIKERTHLKCLTWVTGKMEFVVTWDGKTTLVAQMVKRLPTMWERPGFDPWVRKIPWRRKWQPTPVFLPGKSHGPRSLAGYSLWGHKELDMTEHTHKLFFNFYFYLFIWLCWVLVVAHRIFNLHCGMQDLVLWSGMQSRAPTLRSPSLSHWTTIFHSNLLMFWLPSFHCKNSYISWLPHSLLLWSISHYMRCHVFGLSPQFCPPNKA